MENHMSETIGQKWDKASKATRGKINSNLTPDDSPKATQAVLNLMQAKALDMVLQTAELDDELAVVLDRIRPNLTPVDMMKATQAVLNLMHARAQAEGVKGSAKKTQTN
jgi:hypothetical protein